MQGNGFCNVQFLRELQRDRKAGHPGIVERAVMDMLARDKLAELKKKDDDDVEVTGVDLSRCPAA